MLVSMYNYIIYYRIQISEGIESFEYFCLLFAEIYTFFVAVHNI